MGRLAGYIDLSKRRVSPEDIIKCEERYNKSKMVHSIMRHVAEKTQHPIEDLYERIGWPLNKKYGHAVDAFKLSITYVYFYLLLGARLTLR
jgi:translation initiation factor 2 subunit 1